MMQNAMSGTQDGCKIGSGMAAAAGQPRHSTPAAHTPLSRKNDMGMPSSTLSWLTSTRP